MSVILRTLCAGGDGGRSEAEAEGEEEGGGLEVGGLEVEEAGTTGGVGEEDELESESESGSESESESEVAGSECADRTTARVNPYIHLS